MSLAPSAITDEPLSILFVDDDPSALNGTIRHLQKVRSDWRLQVCGNGAKAIDIVSTSRVDVIVCDVQLAGRGGIELLREVQSLSPATARVILAEDPDRQVLFDSTRVAHQFFEKPCNVDRLRAGIEQIAACRQELAHETVEAVVGEADRLPTPGPVHDELMQELSGDYTIRSLERIVTSDVAITAELLRMVNSSFFGLVRRLERVGDAITFLGVDVMAAIVASRSLFRPDPDSIVDVAAVNLHSRAVASLAALAHGGSSTNAHLKTQAFAAGLLHDVGVLVLGQIDQGERAKADAAQLLDAHDLLHERLTYGADRYSIASYLLSLWGFDAEIAVAVESLGQPVHLVERTGLSWTVRIAHEAVLSARITADQAIDGDDIDLKIALAEIVEELDVRGTVARPKYAPA